MEYFILQTDDRNTRPLKVAITPAELKDEKTITKKLEVSQSGQSCEVEYVDFIGGQAPLFADKLKDLIAGFYPELNWRAVFVITQDTNLVYWLLDEPLVDDVIERSNDRERNLMAKKELLEGKNLFIARYEKIGRATIAPLGLAESILRNNISGIKLTKLTQI
jgi:hypothetical protein